MSINELLATLKANGITLSVKDGQLAVQGNRFALTEKGLVVHLREHKPALIALIEQGEYQASRPGAPALPENGIPRDCTRITPEMLTLVSLDQDAIDRLVAQVPGNAANVQDIYPLAPLQQGILYHHVTASQGDPYVMHVQFAFADRTRLEAFALALQTVIERHDILRTSIHWDGLDTPVQVVWRQAQLKVGALGAVAQAMMDLGQAPLIRLVYDESDSSEGVKATLQFHHIAMDHSALDVVRHEIHACLQGQAELLGAPVPFRNYVGQALLGVSEQEHEAFFREMLGDLDEPTLAYNLQDLSGDGDDISEHTLALDLELCRRLRGHARSQAISVASLFHLGWAQVLAGLTGSRRVVFGTVLMGRLLGAEATERALGIFINTLPLRLDLDAQDVHSAVKTTHQRLTALMRHEHAPLALAQRCSGVVAPTPLFNALLNYRHSAAPTTGETWQGIEVLHAQERSNYPLVMSVDDLGEAFSFSAQTTNGIDPQRICAYLERAMAQLLDALEQTPQLPIQQIEILPAGERELLLEHFNGDHLDQETALTLHQRIERQALDQPDAIASHVGDQHLSYGELNVKANALAHHLISLGVRPDDRVAVVARRGLETLVALLAVLKSGGCYVPVDPAHPQERIAYLLSDSAPAAVLTQQALLANLPPLTVPVIALDRPDWADQQSNPQVAGLTATNLAYVIYTSGSTGQPKGVMVEHRTLSNLVHWHCQAFDLHAGSHTASVAGFGFDAMAWEVWPALCAGSTLHLPPAEVSNEQLDALLDWWLAQPLHVAFLPTPVAEYAFSRDLRHPTLRTLLIGGDRLRQFQRDPGFAVINNYGPTEATVVATSGPLLPDGRLDIGKPIANTRIYVLDEHQQLLPLGVAGELYVAGEGVARGYLNRPELTAERFLRDPFVASPQARMYRTGDLVRWNSDGTLDYLGRNDDQVKIRGVRIELGEIESQLAQLPGIEEALVLAREDEPGQQRLVAYFIENGGTTPLTELRAAMLSTLPGYMVPSAFVRLDAWPLTANGKVDRRALPAPDRDALFTGEYQAPEGELEIALAQIWSELLQVERVGRHDNFFELGGHSLLAMRMVSQVRQRLSLELVLGDLFADGTLLAVAQCLSNAIRDELPAIEVLPRSGAMPLSFAQQRIWFLAQMEDANSAYNIPLGLQLTGQLDSRALRSALERIVARHDSLRSRFTQQDGEAFVHTAPVTVVPELCWQDLRGQDEHALQAVVQEEAAQPFDLTHDLPIRGRVLCLAEDRHVLLLTVHHIVADGWSLGVLTRELTALYQAFSQGLDDPLPPLALQYGDYAVWQRDWLNSERLSHQSDYWHQALLGAPVLLTLPTDRPRPARQDYTGASIAVRIAPRLSAEIKRYCQRHAVTPFMLFMGAWSVLLARLSGQDEVVVGTPVANRRRAEVEGLIGLFVNTLAVRIDTSGEPDGATLLARIKTRVLQAQEHQDLPFEQVVERLRPPRSLAHSPLFQTSLAWDGSQGLELHLGDLHLEPLADQPTFAKFDLTLSMAETAEGFSGALDYATALFDKSTVERYAAYLEPLLWSMVASDNSAPIKTAAAQTLPAQVALLSAQERRRLLVDFNASEQPFTLHEPLPRLFEARADIAPDAIAVASQGVQLSYRQLNEAANRLAYHLIDQGIQPDQRVAVCLERGPQLIIGLLAVLKAGGAYVPLDPGYPTERLAYMLADSAALTLLVDASTQARFARTELHQVNLDACTWSARSTANPVLPGLSARHLAYVIYTSGSTGTPKGVMVEHRGLCNLVQWSSQLIPATPAGAVLHKTPVSFDASVWELFWPLCAGLRLVLARPDGQRDPAYLAQLIIDQQVSVVQFVPALLQQFLELEESSQCSSLTDIVCGGGELTEALARQVRQCLPWVRLHNVYGPTEATVDCSVWTLEPNDPVPDHALPIGRPISNTRLYVLDRHDQPVPLGVVGQLHIGGAGVARGYLNLPHMQAERFIDSPFVAGDRLYRSGDLVRQRADGVLEFLGRNDFQVKLHGLRIELGEIEARLSLHPAIREVAVLLHNERLVAWFSCHSGQPAPGIEALREHVLAQLPDYMVPSAYVAVANLPLSPNGKLDRSALPEPDEHAVLSRHYEAPQGSTETQLAELWAELLHRDKVGRQDHFFEMGGHSLLAVTLIARMRRLGMTADIRVLFSQPTLAALASAVDSSGAGELQVPANLIGPHCQRITPDLLPLVSLDQSTLDRIVASVPGGAANVQDIYPLGPLQAGILYHHLAAGERDPYVLQPQFAFADRARLDAFCAALQRVIQRNDILRTAFFWEGVQAPVQVVWRQAGLKVEAVALQELDSAPPMDLTQAPLLHLLYAEDPANQRIAAVLRFHHVVMDHVALEVLGHELQAMLLNQEALLAAPVPYRNYVAQVLQGPGDEAHERFFREQLGDIDEPTLPYGVSVAAGEGALGEARLPLDHALCGKVREQARQLGVSAASLMHLAWAQVLGQLSGRDSVVFGTVLLGRLQGGEGVERALGVFINTLPLRIDLGTQPVRDAVLETHRRLTGLLAHEHAQLALAQRCSALPAGAPLFSTLLNYRHSAAPQARDPAANTAWQGIEVLNAEERSNYPLTLSIDDLGDAFSLTAQAAHGIDAQRICVYVQQAVINLVQALEHHPEQSAPFCSVLPAAERQRLLVEFNATRRDYPRDQPVHRVFEQRAARHPQAIAALHGSCSLTYAELNASANRLAHYLIGHGVKPNDHVAMLLPRSLELLIGQLAISKCAATYVPLDVNAPAERQAQTLDDCKAVCVLALSSVLINAATRRIDLDVLVLDDQSAHDPNLPQASDSVAYVMYTSGSTGAPKGVRVLHRGIARLVLNNGFADFNQQDSIALASNPAFDASTLEVWGALLNGGRLRVIDHPTLMDPVRFSVAVREVSVLFITTALFNQYVQLIPEAFKGLRYLLTGGERADPDSFRTLLAQAPGVRLLNGYGPTETTTFATTHEVRAVADGADSISIGRPIGNTTLYVLDAHQRLVPQGVVGELYIGGDGVASGYLNRAELTAEKFLPDPFSDQAHATMYRTGDLGRWLEDGQLECLGRNDDQVKIRGFRIELGEIVSRLHSLPGVRDAVVLAREDERGRVCLVAYFTGHQGQDIEALSPEQMRAALQASLPEYMVPAAFVELAALPLTANGKLDRRALPKPDRSALFGVTYEAPQGEVEIALAQIWADVLQVEQVGRHDHFFDLGGHSLLAMRMVSQVRQQLGVELPLGELFAHGELAAVAAAITGIERRELSQILPVARDQSLPLSFAQQRLWFLAQMDGGNEAYNIPMALNLKGALDVAALSAALARVVARHETLRSRFVSRDDGAEVLFTAASGNAQLSVEDLRQAPEAVAERVRTEAAIPFDLSHGPVIRSRLLWVAEDHHVLLLTVHHIVADGWSMGILTGELLALYSALRSGQADPLPALAIQYTDYAVWQRQWLTGERLQQQATYWREALDDAPTLLMLPTDRPRPAQQNFAGGSLAMHLDGPLSAGLRALAQRHGVTIYMTLMTAWASLLTRLSGQTDVVIGSPMAGRGRSELEGLVGLFVNTLAVRIDTSGTPTCEALLAQVKARVLQAQEHQDLPFEQVVEAVRPERSLAHAPLFQTTVNWLAGTGSLPAPEGLRVSAFEQQSQVSKFDLSLNLHEQGEELVGTLDYATALFDPASVRRFAHYFEQLLQAMVHNEHAALDQVTLVGEQERRYLLEGLNATTLDIPQGQTIHGLIETQAARYPDAIASQVGDQHLSYGELNVKANALAHHLISLGVRPDDRVAVVARRGLETLVALLAVLKSGGCYVPVDPAHPQERIAYLLSDSAPVAVLTQHTLLADLPPLTVPVIALDRPDWADQQSNPQVAGLTATNLAYVIYTSGSTGQPKGVMVEHRTLSNLVHWHCQAFDLHAGSHTASVAGFGFDAMAWEVWPALCAGSTLHLPPEEVSNEQLDALLDWWLAQPLHVAFLPTPVAEYAFSRDLRHPTLRTLLIGGDRLRQFQRDPGFAVINNYGPTEATVVATSGPLLPDGRLDIGKPIANTRIYVLDEHQQLLPLGFAGELYVAGEGVARGYLNRPELTAERFLRDPFVASPQARMYRTGDLVRWNSDGTLDYLGRNDDQVKIRGVRIELGEIESQLAQLPGIEEALVLAREDEPGQQRLVAYFIENGGTTPLTELRAAMLSTLPGYMVPSAFVRLDAWPLTANGKVDRRALPAPDRDALFTGEYQAPEGEMEIALAQIWSELLQVERVGRHDNFFELGGHSLLAVTLVARMRRLGLDVDIRVLFAQPTLAALANGVGGRHGVDVPANGITPDCLRITPDLLPLIALDQSAIDRIVASVPGGVANVQDIYPLGPLQAGIFYHYLSAVGDDPYQLQARFAFDSRERLNAFCVALQRVIARNDVLRTALSWEGLQAPVQVVWRSAELPVVEVPLAGLADTRPLALDQAPLLRLVHAADPVNQRIVAVLQFHHLIMDHMALELLSHELQAVLLGLEAQLPAPVPYRNYIAQALLGPNDAAHEAFFREQLGDIDEPTLPYGQASLPGAQVPGESKRRLDPVLSGRVREQARQSGVSAASLMHLAWAQVLAALSGRDKVVFGTVLLGRLQGGEGVERTLGVFINTLPLRIDLGDQPVREAVLQTHRRLTGLLAHEHASLALAQRCSALPAGAALFSALFNYRHSASPQVADESAIQAWQGIELLHAEERSNYPLTLSVDDLGDDFELSALTSAGIDARRICAYMNHAVEGLMLALEQAPHNSVQTLGVLPAVEQVELLQGFNGLQALYETDLTIHQRIEHQALLQPDAIAAQVGGQCLSYGELNRRANGLAEHLISLGVRPDDRVAVLARRGLETLVGLLAVLKAGAGYVPVDPAHPDERISYLLENSAPTVVLTQLDLLQRLPEVSVPVINLDAAEWPASPDNPNVQGLTAGHLAYVIYTSGSTGLPKGVMVEHHTLSNLVDWHCQAFDLHPGSHTASVAGFGFDAMAWEVWPALCAGAVLHIPPREIENEQLGELLDWWLAQPLQVAFLPTPVAEYVFTHELRHPTLRTLLIGGDRLRHFKRDPGFAVVNNYGPTEATVVASSGRVQVGGVLHIGKPVTHARLYVLDARQQPVPLGVPGELYIGGAGVARGYLNRPDLTAERFLDDPFTQQPGARMYRSGDLVRWLADGTLEYLGRNDDQVKIRGVRIEPGEIEQQLAQCPGVGEVVVVTQRLEDGALRLVAYFTRLNPALDGATLRAHLLGRLPEYMVPAAYVGLDLLPLTQNGKVDRRALPMPSMDAMASAAYQAPETPLEQRLAELWAEVLEVGRVGRHDSFFELGGHSLTAIRLVSLIQKSGVPLTLAELFQHASIAALAGLLDQRPAGPTAAQEVIAVRAEGNAPPLFLIHDFTGLDAYFPALGRHLDGDFPIYGLPGIGLGQPQLRTMECLAERLVERIREVQPHGPYRLAGWSFGGVLAYEVATQLLGLDEEVGFLGLIDSYVPRLTDQGKTRWQGPNLLERQLLSHCTAYWTAYSRDHAGQGTAQLARLASVLEQPAIPGFEALLSMCREEQLLYPELAQASDAQLQHYLEREVAHGHALAHYRLEPLNLPVHLFRAQERPIAPVAASATLGWGEILQPQQLHSIDVPGDHQSMMQAPHVQRLGQAIVEVLKAEPAKAASAPVYQGLLAIQSGKAGHAPLFCLPGAGDSVTSFMGLAEALGTDWPVYGLQPRGLDGRNVPHSRVEAAAQCYRREIEAFYPQGPLHLVGHSFGGWAAHAMAVEFQARGREVISLTLIDSQAPGGEGACSKPYTTTAALKELIEALQLSSGKHLSLDSQAFADSDDATQLRLLQEAMVRVGLLPPRFAPQALHGIVRTFGTALRTVYQPKPGYSGPASLVRVADTRLDAETNLVEQAAMAVGWQHLLPQLALWDGPGHHFSILKAPDVYSLAAWWYERQAVGVEQTLS